MVMLQSPIKSSDSSQTPTAGSQLSPNSNPSSPKSNTSPDSATTAVGSDSGCNNNNNMKLSKLNSNKLNNNNNKNNHIEEESGILYSIERLKQMTESGILSPTTDETDGETDVKKLNNNTTPTTSTPKTTMGTATNITLTSTTNFVSLQQRKLLELSKLTRPEPLSPLQHSHAMLLQQHPQLLQHPQFLAAAAAQQQHQLHQQHLSNHHQFQATVFPLRPPISTLPPSPANSPLSPPTSPTPAASQLSSAGASPILLSPQQQHSLQQQLLSSPTPSSMLLSSQHGVVTANSPPSTATGTTTTLSPNDMDMERIKLVAAQAVAARSHPASMMSALPLPQVSGTRADLSDYGFRIQLGGLAAAAAAAAATSRQIAAANYTRSDTSEELNVDGNDEDSNECSTGTPSVCPVDLTRNVSTSTSIPTTSASTTSTSTCSENEPKRLAFSVENILDPNKFTGKQVNDSRHWGSNSSNCDRDDDMHDRLDDEQSENMSGK